MKVVEMRNEFIWKLYIFIWCILMKSLYINKLFEGVFILYVMKNFFVGKIDRNVIS